MKQFLNILNFEFMGYLKNKVFVGSTVVLIALVGVVLFFPRIMGLFNNDNKIVNEEEKTSIIVVDKSSQNKEMTLSIFQKAMPNSDIKLSDNKSVDELKNIIDNGDCDSAIVIDSPTKYSYIVKDVTMYDRTQYLIDEIMLKKYQTDSILELGISEDKISELLEAKIDSEIILTGVDQMQNFFYTYILIFALYMAILLYGQFVATSVATEKSSRAMELLITSAKPANLMFGKVIGSGIAGLLQLSAILVSSFVFYNLNKSYWDENPVINSIFNMPVSILLYTILFFVLGYFIYAFLYGAVGSLASKVEDINTSVMPITFLFIIAFFIVIFSMSSGNVDSMLMKVASYVPFTSPMAMFVRISMSEVAAIEVIISVGILVISTIGIGYLSAKIYKIGVLLYGKPPKISNILKAMIR